MSLFDSFGPLDPASAQAMVNYHKQRVVDSIANTIATDTKFRSKFPMTEQAGVSSHDGALQWLRGLIPATANPGSNWKQYFLASYKSTWITGRYKGNEGMRDLALAISGQLGTARGLSPGMNYYQTVQSMAPAANAPQAVVDTFNRHVRKQWVGVKQIGWRGDDREPNVMMKAGFEPRVSTTTPVWRPQAGMEDVDLDTTVCVARDIRGCAFFPLSKPIPATWAYCVRIRVGWNTYYVQKELAREKGITDTTSAAYRKKVWLFHEKCVSKIEPADIILAIRLERKIHDGRSPLSGIKFTIKDGTGKLNMDAFESLSLDQRHEVESVLSPYLGSWYPQAPNEWLTYDGVVTK
jgi:hypothetical protein